MLDVYKARASGPFSVVRLMTFPSNDTSAMAHTTHTSAREIIAEMKGQSLVLPDLWQYMPADNWPVNLHPDILRLREHVQERFQWYV